MHEFISKVEDLLVQIYQQKTTSNSMKDEYRYMYSNFKSEKNITLKISFFLNFTYL